MTFDQFHAFYPSSFSVCSADDEAVDISWRNMLVSSGRSLVVVVRPGECACNDAEKMDQPPAGGTKANK